MNDTEQASHLLISLCSEPNFVFPFAAYCLTHHNVICDKSCLTKRVKYVAPSFCADRQLSCELYGMWCLVLPVQMFEIRFHKTTAS
jgi:hypothetical protein